jgi:hypothetical protein
MTLQDWAWPITTTQQMLSVVILSASLDGSKEKSSVLLFFFFSISFLPFCFFVGSGFFCLFCFV